MAMEEGNFFPHLVLALVFISIFKPSLTLPLPLLLPLPLPLALSLSLPLPLLRPDCNASLSSGI